MAVEIDFYEIFLTLSLNGFHTQRLVKSQGFLGQDSDVFNSLIKRFNFIMFIDNIQSIKSILRLVLRTDFTTRGEKLSGHFFYYSTKPGTSNLAKSSEFSLLVLASLKEFILIELAM